MRRRVRRWLIGVGAALSLVLVVAIILGVAIGCALLKPLPPQATVAQRIEAFPVGDVPVSGRVRVYWDDHLIPFIEADSDEDLAFALGMVHAHLRLGQMEMLRRIARGRLAEMFGPPATGVDQSLRILNLPQAAGAIHESMPEETRQWLAEFVRGVNFVQERSNELPHELEVGGVEAEVWTSEDVIAIARLGAADVSWLTWFRLLPFHGQPGFEELFEKFLSNGTSSVPSFSVEKGELLPAALGGAGRTGSNSFVVSAHRSATGSALIANDPHLGISIPGLWLIVGLKSPSYHLVGMMFPGVPIPAIGRSEYVAWGGTNMRAATSDLYDVSGLADDAIRTRRERIGVRWWFDRTVEVRETDLGPILSDSPLLKAYEGPPIAVRWVGHQVSDEFTPMLRASRARDWEQFRDVFADYAVPGMNILYADAKGNIGQLLAVRVPIRNRPRPSSLLQDPTSPESPWRGFLGPDDLPVAYNPPEGFLVSSNNVPVQIDTPIGYLFSSNDRVMRITELLESDDAISVDDAGAIQTDVFSITDAALRDVLMEKIAACGLGEPDEDSTRALLTDLAAWDGCYASDSRGAVAFQALLAHFARSFYQHRYGDRGGQVVVGASYARDFLRRDLPGSEPAECRPLLERALSDATETAGAFATWGDMHRLVLGHFFRRLPMIGDRYQFEEHPISGSAETINKTAHPLEAAESETFYGACARHISDFSDPDENYFVLLGGQDGRLNSDAALDQVPLWLEGKSIRVPLRLESVRAAFRHHQDLQPASARPNHR
jgi:penicillin G amidase